MEWRFAYPHQMVDEGECVSDGRVHITRTPIHPQYTPPTLILFHLPHSSNTNTQTPNSSFSSTQYNSSIPLREDRGIVERRLVRCREEREQKEVRYIYLLIHFSFSLLLSSPSLPSPSFPLPSLPSSYSSFSSSSFSPFSPTPLLTIKCLP